MTSGKKVVFLAKLVGLFVSLSVCKITLKGNSWILTTFSENDLDHHLNPGMFLRIYLHCEMGLALLKAQFSLQLGEVFYSDNGVLVSIMYSYMY